MQHIVIIGATSSIAEHCTRVWAQAGAARFTLVGRDLAKVKRVAQDLQVRHPAVVTESVDLNFLDVNAIESWVASVAQQDPVDIVLIAHGSLPDQSLCQASLPTSYEALQINGVSPVLFAEAFASSMVKANHGTIAIIGSVAGDRGRQSNYVYGAAKGMVARYAQGMQHRLVGTGVQVVLVKPGPTDTPMTRSFKLQGQKLASPEKVARDIVKGVQRGTPVIYTPGKWRLIMAIIVHLPSFVFNKLRI